jgi:hypothetical protein
MTLDSASDKGLQVVFTVDDPKVFTTPWSAAVTYLQTTTEWSENTFALRMFMTIFLEPLWLTPTGYHSTHFAVLINPEAAMYDTQSAGLRAAAAPPKAHLHVATIGPTRVRKRLRKRGEESSPQDRFRRIP